MKNRLNNAVVAITGAGSGIGRALALACANQGAKLAISDINADALQSTFEAAKAENSHIEVTQQVLDVSDKQQVSDWAKQTSEHFGVVNVIINNAGVAVSSSVESIEYADFEWLMNINFWGVVYGSKSFLPYLQQAPWGHIVNISSLFGLISTPNSSAYNAAKFAVRGFSESLRIELMMSNEHITVSCVHPGGIKTNIANSAREGKGFLGVASRMSTLERKQQFNDKMARLTPDQAAEIIIKGMLRKKGKILVGTDAKWLDRLQRLMPVGYQKIVKRVFR